MMRKRQSCEGLEKDFPGRDKSKSKEWVRDEVRVFEELKEGQGDRSVVEWGVCWMWG